MKFRRALVWIASLAIGSLAVVAGLMIFRTTIERFSYSNTVLVFLGISGFGFIWLDYLLKTNYLRR
ncbi:MAG: hypothetical protein AB1449_09265 [Chloroflexota bacterium]